MRSAGTLVFSSSSDLRPFTPPATTKSIVKVSLFHFTLSGTVSVVMVVMLGTDCNIPFCQLYLFIFIGSFSDRYSIFFHGLLSKSSYVEYLRIFSTIDFFKIENVLI